MTQDDVKTVLLEVLNTIQTACALPSPKLTGADVPAKVLPKFDSVVWPAATSLLAKKLDIVIPADVHIFGSSKGELLTIDQTAQLVVAKHKPKSSLAVAAE